MCECDIFCLFVYDTLCMCVSGGAGVCSVCIYMSVIRSLRRRKKTTDTTDSGYDTTSLMRKQQQMPNGTTIKTLVAMSRFKEKLSKGDEKSSSDKRLTNATPGEKFRIKQTMKEVPKSDKKILKYTNFSNLVDRRPRIRKEQAQVVTMKTIRAIQILPF